MLSLLDQLNFTAPAPVAKSRKPRKKREDHSAFRQVVVAKYLAVLTAEWQTNADIATTLGLNIVSVRKFLGDCKELVGVVEGKNVRAGRSYIKYWRLQK